MMHALGTQHNSPRGRQAEEAQSSCAPPASGAAQPQTPAACGPRPWQAGAAHPAPASIRGPSPWAGRSQWLQPSHWEGFQRGAESVPHPQAPCSSRSQPAPRLQVGPPRSAGHLAGLSELHLSFPAAPSPDPIVHPASRPPKRYYL